MVDSQDLVTDEDVDKEIDEVKHDVDRGWAWVIVAAAFCINFIHMGMYRSYGFLFVELLKEFKASTSLTSLVVGVYSAANSLTAFVTLNFLVKRFSIRVLCACGGFLMTLGGVLSYFAMNLEFLIFTQSCLSGIGAALLTGPCIVVVGQYFDKRRALAQGISSCGTSLGSMAVPQLTRFLFSIWGVRTTLLISGGIEATIILFALFFRPISKLEPNPQKIPMVEGNVGDELRSLVDPHTNKEPLIGEDNAKVKSSSFDNGINQKVMSVDGNDVQRHCAGVSSQDPQCYEQVDVKLAPGNGGIHIKNGKCSNEEEMLIQCYEYGTCKTTYEPIKADEDNLSYRVKCKDCDKERPFQKEITDNNFSQTSESADNDISLHEKDSAKEAKASRSCRCKPSFLDCKIFLLPHFYLIIGQHIFGSVVALFSAFLPATAEEIGLSSLQAATLLTIFAGVDCGSRLLSGIIVHTGKIKSHHLLAASLVAEGILFHFTRFYTSSISMMVYAGLFGLFCGAIPAMDPVVMTNFLGQKYLPNSLGITMLIHGAVLAGLTPLLGALRDSTGSFYASYHLMGTFSIISGIFLLCEPLAKMAMMRKRKEVRRNEYRTS